MSNDHQCRHKCRRHPASRLAIAALFQVHQVDSLHSHSCLLRCSCIHIRKWGQVHYRYHIHRNSQRRGRCRRTHHRNPRPPHMNRHTLRERPLDCRHNHKTPRFRGRSNCHHLARLQRQSCTLLHRCNLGKRSSRSRHPHWRQDCNCRRLEWCSQGLTTWHNYHCQYLPKSHIPDRMDLCNPRKTRSRKKCRRSSLSHRSCTQSRQCSRKLLKLPNPRRRRNQLHRRQTNLSQS